MDQNQNDAVSKISHHQRYYDAISYYLLTRHYIYAPSGF